METELTTSIIAPILPQLEATQVRVVGGATVQCGRDLQHAASIIAQHVTEKLSLTFRTPNGTLHIVLRDIGETGSPDWRLSATKYVDGKLEPIEGIPDYAEEARQLTMIQ